MSNQLRKVYQLGEQDDALTGHLQLLLQGAVHIIVIYLLQDPEEAPAACRCPDDVRHFTVKRYGTLAQKSSM